MKLSLYLALAVLFACPQYMLAQENVLPRPWQVVQPSSQTRVTFVEIQNELVPALESTVGQEGYTLEVTPEGIVRICAATETGLFYGAQTVQQLRQPSELGQTTFSVPVGVKIVDKPRFKWRALMLDEARHFYGVETVKQILDQMAQIKLNVFHWHLTDDTGWRIEIKQFPKLTTIGAYRSDTEAETWGSGKREGKPHQGFYTQEQIRAIVQYATARHITVVPEIDVPGHSSAACAAYPELHLTLKQPKTVPILFGGKNNTALDPTNEAVYAFYSAIFDEISTLFPSKIVHMGGDEVRYNQQWQDQPKLTAFMAEHHMKSFTDLQLYFTNRIAKLLKAKGLQVVGWTEVLGADIHGDGDGAMATGPTDGNIIIQHWDWQNRTDDIVKEAARRGQQIINSKVQWTYLDQPYSKISLKKTFEFEPILPGLEPAYQKNIIGLGTQLWTEWVPDVPTLQKQLFPRLFSFAEIGWSPKEGKNWGDFLRRVQHYHGPRLEKIGIQYAKEEVK